MDFHMLTRRELQALCKKNKIPANMTNIAMADSLKALEIVEGIEEFLQTCESETAQSSIESPVRSEVTSPYVPPTGGRSTRRGNVAKEEPETVKPSARTQRTTRRTLAKYADEPQPEAIETPAMVPQTNRRKGQIASACRKMDSQLKECIEEKKKDVLVTPAPSVVSTRRRRGVKEESTVKRVYGTRRSVRLAGKNVELLNEVEDENPDFSKKDLFITELKTNMKESRFDLDEKSGITGVVDAGITVGENSGKKDETEVVSAEKQDISTVDEVEAVPTIEDEISNHSESDGAKTELKESSVVEIEQVGVGSEIEAQVDKEKCDQTEASNDENKAQENDGSLDVQTSENEIEVEKLEQQNADKDAGYEDQAANCGDNDVLKSEERDTDKDAGCEDQAGNYGENIVLESEGRFGISEVSCDIDSHEIEKEISKDNDLDSEDATDLNVNKEVPEINGSHDVQPSESEIKVEKTEEQTTDKDAGYEDQVANCGENAALEIEEQNTDKDAGSHDVQHSEIEIEVEKTEEENTDEDAGYEDHAADSVENADLENKEHDTDKDAGSSEIEIEVEKTEEENTDEDAGYEDQAADSVENAGLENKEHDTDKDAGSHDVQHSEIEIEVEKTEEENTDEDAGYEDHAADSVENAGIENKEHDTDKDAGSHDVHHSEIEIEVEKTEEENTDEDAGYEDQAADSVENAGLESKEHNTDKDAGSEDEVANCLENPVLESEDNIAIGIHNEIEKVVSNDNDLDSPDVIDLDVNEEVLEINDSGEKELNPDELESVILEAVEESIDVTYPNTDDSLDEMPFDISLMNEEEEAAKWDAVLAYISEKHDAIEEKDETNLVKDTELEPQQSAEEVSPGKELDNVAVDEAGETDITQTEENKKATDQVPCLDQPTCLTPIRASVSKAPARKKRVTAVSDNKENIGSEGKFVLTKERAKIAKNTAKNGPNLDDMSVRQLTKMLKEKLQITNKPSKSENDSEVPPARPALQALPENRLADKTS